MNEKKIAWSLLSLAVATGVIGFALGPIHGAWASGAPEDWVMAVPYNNPVEAERAGFPAQALSVNRAADGTMSWMMTPSEIRRERDFKRLYLDPAQNRVAARISDGSRNASSALFGVTDTSTEVISGTSFQPRTAVALFNKSVTSGVLTCSATTSSDEFVAQLNLPSGALITGMRAYGDDTSAADDANYFIYKYCNTGTGPTFSTTVATANVTSGFVGGDYAVNSAAVGHTVDNSDCTYTVQADFSEGTCDGLNNLHMVAVRWKRQIAPDPATTSFTDVPLGHPFHREVEALVAAGITGGCGGSNYCPNASVTRGQMAAYLARALGLHWEDN